MLWAACCVGFFAFMRSGELALPNGATFDPARHITPQDVAVDNPLSPTALRLHLKQSKTDVARDGVDIFIGRSYTPLCPVVALLQYLMRRGWDDGPLFRRRDGSPLTRRAFVALVKQVLSEAGVDATHFSGYSFRIGAATSAAANGLDDATIQVLGRWRSSSCTRYIRPPS